MELIVLCVGKELHFGMQFMAGGRPKSHHGTHTNYTYTLALTHKPPILLLYPLTMTDANQDSSLDTRIQRTIWATIHGITTQNSYTHPPSPHPQLGVPFLGNVHIARGERIPLTMVTLLRSIRTSSLDGNQKQNLGRLAGELASLAEMLS